MIKVTLLYGGLFSFDGPVTSAGMSVLEKQLKKLPQTTVRSYLWGDTQTAYDDILKQATGDKTVVIGYSGGGMSATYLANLSKVVIDLMVLYDPSPAWNMKPVGANVKKAVCYQNQQKTFVPFIGWNPANWWVGGGVLRSAPPNGPKVIVEAIDEPHMQVEWDQNLHNKTMKYVKELLDK